MRHPTPRDAFTLVEMMLVIGLIVLLAGLLIPAAGWALNRARRAKAVTEIAQLQTAMGEYYQIWDEYPPDSVPGENWDSGQCLVFYLGTRFRAGEHPTPPWSSTPMLWTATRSGGPLFDFPADRIGNVEITGNDNHWVFVDPWGSQDRDDTGLGMVCYYQFDNNLAEDGDGAPWWDASASASPGDEDYDNWNQTNAHRDGVDIWCAGPDAMDMVAGTGGHHPDADSPIQDYKAVMKRLLREDDVHNF